MICPHCGVAFCDESEAWEVGEEAAGTYELRDPACPECKGLVLILSATLNRPPDPKAGRHFPTLYRRETVVWPLARMRPVAAAVPFDIAADFQEAAAVADISPKAAAALGRRCLQAVLRDKGDVRSRDLHSEIAEVLERGDLPTYVSEVLHGLRKFGNLGAHPERAAHTGEVVQVEPGEAEWMLSALEAVFDHYYVKPAQTQQVLAGLERKRQPVSHHEVDQAPPE